MKSTHVNTECRTEIPRSRLLFYVLTAVFSLFLLFFGHKSANAHSEASFLTTIEKLAAYGDRSSGTEGAVEAADYIESFFTSLGYEEVKSHRFPLAVRKHNGSVLTALDSGRSVNIHPFFYNAVTPQAIAPEGLEGPLVYVGTGEVDELNGRIIENSIILMEFNSGKNWLGVASIGARALIFVDRGDNPKTSFSIKKELSPVDFPIFIVKKEVLEDLFGTFEEAPDGIVASKIKLSSNTVWETAPTRNIYCLVPGTNKEYEDQILIVEAFYDNDAMVPGRSPGADEAVSIATLLEIAATLKENPPERPVALVASSGHAQSLAGMREMIWSLRERSRELRNQRKELKQQIEDTQKKLEALKTFDFDSPRDEDSERTFIDAVSETIKTKVDFISQELMRLRLQELDQSVQKQIKVLADSRFLLRRIGWRTDLENLTEEEEKAYQEVIPDAIDEQKERLKDAKDHDKYLKSANTFRTTIGGKDVSAIISLHLSSRGDGVGAFNDGWLYKLKPEINRLSSYTKINDVMLRASEEVASSLNVPNIFRDTLRPSRLRRWQSYFIDNPQLGGEVSAIAGYLGLTLATVNDGRQYWGTPYDAVDKIDLPYAVSQSAFVCELIRRIANEPELQTGQLPRNGFSTVLVRANFIRHGELFADKPAPGTTVLAFQGPSTYHAVVNSLGFLQLKGMADRKHVYDKVILEGYKFDRKTGEPIWAIDKKQTGKDSYRVKMNRRNMETDLIMFSCRQMTLFNLLEPRSFRFMTRLQLLDGRLEAQPLRYWYSRIDTNESNIASIYLEPGTRMKLTLSDSVMDKKLILLNSSPENPNGEGYLIDAWPALHKTELHAARDMWTLLKPRIENLEERGIFNEKIRTLQLEGVSALKLAEEKFNDRRYGEAFEAASKSWALATRVYSNVEKTQKDVLFGVLFYIALFVPFAFCVERFLFSYSDIHKRIIAFLGILLALIVVIYNVHPAFKLAYSPTVVILAFFIMGLSLIVTLIIFFRFEEEMEQLQKRANQTVASEMGRWQAFTASFFLGVSNLRRRRLRTVLTCTTLVILTFTIMSFTSVKSLRHRAQILFQPSAPYYGFLLKNANWIHMSPDAINKLSNAFAGKGILAPRSWLEAEDRSRATSIPILFNDKEFEAQGLMGLSAEEPQVTGLDKILTGGRWFGSDEPYSVIIPKRMAENLGINPEKPEGSVLIWGVPFNVVGVFSGEKLEANPDLDGEPLTPVIFPGESSYGVSEMEIEAMESGEDVRAFQGRYQHISPDQTIIIPYNTLMNNGGSLKGVAVKPLQHVDLEATSDYLVDRFKLAMFIGREDGTFLIHASDTLSYSGVPNIIIPILISIFIVLNTMIGSVYERKREIAIYTSVGLAPSHVSFLFIAEAMAFAVLSVVLGYLFAQGTAALFAGTSLWEGITVNYSSLAGVAAMILIFLVVLVSVIYPSKVAAQIAIPDVNRSWTLPEAAENMLELTLPMLLKIDEANGVGGFLYHHLKSHKDVSHGLFSTGEMRVDFICDFGTETDQAVCHDSKDLPEICIHFQCKVWLAPFDFGIMQRVEVELRPAHEDPGYLEINLRLVREAGEANIWRRINKAFINQLRKQVLIWRSLTKEAQEKYYIILEEALKEVEAEARCERGPEE